MQGYERALARCHVDKEMVDSVQYSYTGKSLLKVPQAGLRHRSAGWSSVLLALLGSVAARLEQRAEVLQHFRVGARAGTVGANVCRGAADDGDRLVGFNLDAVDVNNREPCMGGFRFRA